MNPLVSSSSFCCYFPVQSSFHKHAIQETHPLLHQLILASEEASRHAYAPYSHFRVGASLLITTTIDEKDSPNTSSMSSPVILAGCNVENASYGLTICAEQCVLSKAVAEGCLANNSANITAMVITMHNENDQQQQQQQQQHKPNFIITPCGACRQFIFEFHHATHSHDFILYCQDGQDNTLFHRFTLAQLLPYPFVLPSPSQR